MHLALTDRTSELDSKLTSGYYVAEGIVHDIKDAEEIGAWFTKTFGENHPEAGDYTDDSMGHWSIRVDTDTKLTKMYSSKDNGLTRTRERTVQWIQISIYGDDMAAAFRLRFAKYFR